MNRIQNCRQGEKLWDGGTSQINSGASSRQRFHVNQRKPSFSSPSFPQRWIDFNLKIWSHNWIFKKQTKPGWSVWVEVGGPQLALSLPQPFLLCDSLSIRIQFESLIILIQVNLLFSGSYMYCTEEAIIDLGPSRVRDLETALRERSGLLPNTILHPQDLQKCSQVHLPRGNLHVNRLPLQLQPRLTTQPNLFLFPIEPHSQLWMESESESTRMIFHPTKSINL